MSFFDSPVGRCEAVREMVLLDETQRECAREHGCAPNFDCPLKGYFTECSGVSDPSKLPQSRRRTRARKPATKQSASLSPRTAKRSEALVLAKEAPLPERKVA